MNKKLENKQDIKVEMKGKIMFLQAIDMSDRKLFVKLANMLIRIDGVITEDEKNIINAYKQETQLEEIFYDVNETVESIVKKISDDKVVRNIIVFELLGIAYSDANYSVEEKDFITKICKQLGIDELQLNNIENAVVNCIVANQQATDIIMN